MQRYKINDIINGVLKTDLVNKNTIYTYTIKNIFGKNVSGYIYIKNKSAIMFSNNGLSLFTIKCRKNDKIPNIISTKVIKTINKMVFEIEWDTNPGFNFICASYYFNDECGEKLNWKKDGF